MAVQRALITRYSISFKQKVVREIEEEGLTVSVARRRYGIKGGSTVQSWLRSFGKNHLLSKIVRVEMKGEKDRLKELEAENKRLKLALADATLEKTALATVIEMVNEHYQTDVKKNFGQQSLASSTAKKKGRSKN
ncbi:MAG: transposase [Bacteroidota bacterium]|nr:transposase [Bacteroidota bacterium]